MRFLSRAVTAGGSLLAVALLAACGTSAGLLSSGQASTLGNELTTASNEITNGNCISADRQIQTIQTQIAALPSSVSPTLVNDLSHGTATVLSLARSQCGTNVGTGSDTTSTPTTTTSTQPTTTTTTPTTTTPTTTATTPPPTTTTPPPTTTTPNPPATTPTTTGTGTTGSNGGATLPGGGGGQNSQ